MFSATASKHLFLSSSGHHSISNGLRQGLVQTSVNYRFTNADIKFVLFFKLEPLLACVQKRLPNQVKLDLNQVKLDTFSPQGMPLGLPASSSLNPIDDRLRRTCTGAPVQEHPTPHVDICFEVDTFLHRSCFSEMENGIF